MLLGLLGESECRAALILSTHGVTASEIRRRWPGLTRIEHSGAPLPRRYASSVQSALAAAQARLAEHVRPLVLATEHLLLGIVAGSGETCRWLTERGIELAELEAQIHRLYGHEVDTLAADYDLSPSDDSLATDSMLAESIDIVRDTGADSARSLTGAISPHNEDGAAADSCDLLVTLRVLDAAANRASEGLRVVEDYARFVLDDGHLTGRLKRLRHELAALVARLSPADRCAARDTLADVGTAIEAEGEFHRPDATAVSAANFKRVQESLRSLEEYGKLVDADLARQAEQLRYRTYTLERAVYVTRANLERLGGTRLYVLVDGRGSIEEFSRLVGRLIEAPVDAIQLRDKRIDDRALVERARCLRALTRCTATLAIVNDRPDVARLSQADGVHVGQNELDVRDARRVVGPRTLVGVSTHTIEQARQAVLAGADYIGVGPTFPSRTKSFGDFPGTRLLKQVAAEIRLPVFAIGGIDSENVGEVMTAGISRIAVGEAILAAADPLAAARTLRERLEGRGA